MAQLIDSLLQRWHAQTLRRFCRCSEQRARPPPVIRPAAAQQQAGELVLRVCEPRPSMHALVERYCGLECSSEAVQFSIVPASIPR